MKLTSNDFRVVLVTDEESSAISAKLDKICNIVENKGVSDEIADDISEILSTEDVVESMKEWGKRLWG